MNAAWKMGYDDRKQHRERFYNDGPVGIVGQIVKDYSAGYRAANADAIWAKNNRPPLVETATPTQEPK